MLMSFGKFFCQNHNKNHNLGEIIRKKVSFQKRIDWSKINCLRPLVEVESGEGEK
jgi:hypothetical protein